MNPASTNFQHAELFISPDGQIMAHNITPEIAAILSELNPHDAAMKARAQSASGVSPEDPQPQSAHETLTATLK